MLILIVEKKGFDALNATQKNLSSLWITISEKIKKIRRKMVKNGQNGQKWQLERLDQMEQENGW